MNGIGERIQSIRQEKNLTLAELSLKSKLSKGLLSKIENDINTNPSLETLYSIAKSLGVTIGDILGMDLIRPSREITLTPMPDWAREIRESLNALGKPLDEDILQALYVIHNRKSSKQINKNNWITIYNMLEITLSGK